MGRLKVILSIIEFEISLFQFHYGTIKSKNNRLNNFYIIYISIPLWDD